LTAMVIIPALLPQEGVRGQITGTGGF